MANVTVYNMEGNEVGTMELNDAVFGVEINEHLVHLAVVRQLANNRQGTQKAKTRSEVRGGGRKPWRQKGTGHARQGSIRAPQWTGGGVVFAPVPRDYEVKMNKKERRAALKSALTSKVQDNKLVVVDSLALAEVKTKEMQKVLTNLKAEKALVITADNDQNVILSARNIADVETATPATINTYDVMKHNTVVVTKDAVASIEEVYAMNAMGEKKYTFLVHPEANKTQIKEAVEKMFEGTKVKSVNTINMDGKKKRRGMVVGKTAKTKKAIVALTEESKDIEIFEGL